MNAAKLAATGSAFMILGSLLLAAGCAPTVKVEAPTEPIVINMNIKIEHEIRIKVDRELDDAFADGTLF